MSNDYDLIDRFLRNNLDDADYAEHSTALDRLSASAQQDRYNAGWHHGFCEAIQTGKQPLTDAVRDVLAERVRQTEVEGWTPNHDDEHRTGGMAWAAAAYAAASVQLGDSLQQAASIFYRTGWAKKWFKPRSPREDLIRAGALILAEIERIDRASHG